MSFIHDQEFVQQRRAGAPVAKYEQWRLLDLGAPDLVSKKRLLDEAQD